MVARGGFERGRPSCGRDRHLPAELPYTFEEIAGTVPGRTWSEPRPDVWPPGVRRRLQEVFGPELTWP